ncbi:MAG: hypothetical protein ACFE0O_07695 [Opitutales bacterium]
MNPALFSAPEWLFAKGLVAGFLLAVGTVSGTVWLVQSRQVLGASAAFRVGVSLVLALGFWAAVAMALTGWLRDHASAVLWGVRGIGGLVLGYVALRVGRARRADTLHPDLPEAQRRNPGWNTWVYAVLMPLRLTLMLAMIMATGAFWHGMGMDRVILWTLGVLFGAFVWWGFLFFLAVLFGQRVEEAITLRSLNKLHVLIPAVYGILSLTTLFPFVILLR